MCVSLSLDIVRIVVEEIADGQEYDPRDIQRFKEIDEYATMFIQHGQFQAEFDLDRALRIFHGAMTWRKRHHVYGKMRACSIFILLFLSLDISPNEFPSHYFDRHAIYFRNQDTNNHPLRNEGFVLANVDVYRALSSSLRSPDI